VELGKQSDVGEAKLTVIKGYILCLLLSGVLQELTYTVYMQKFENNMVEKKAGNYISYNNLENTAGGTNTNETIL
jgi:hypothetical protein